MNPEQKIRQHQNIMVEITAFLKCGGWLDM
jgi:hypothetical protein